MNTYFQQALQDDQRVKVGMRSFVYWTNCNHYYRGEGKIAKVNAKTVLVELTKPVAGDYGGYEVGRTISAPRALNYKKWSVNNRFALDETAGQL